ncbi:thiol:disulfide interchange protein DsbA/DsbL [Neiella marina]|uniref:Thiol:disulfide interchange protein n=1 Tax=Neiella holothuriorum TaxID=2870530 RepID=A0ABS7EC43_9GAMM|nr:thiol:disulfide interchange protein DsbA/DsbL [Neiella holothuriorum]MBW8189902.1 thiol:disulfide interchange protein DsbA/DsbL [Neiella holothuriorum]
MKKYLIALFALLALPMAASAANYEEGKHYDVLPGQPTSEPEVVEFFSYYCGHCYKFEPIVKALEQGLKGTELKRAHVDFLYYVDRSTRKRYPETGKIVSRGFAVAQALKVVEPVSEQIYKRHFFEGRQIQSIDDLRDAFADAGVTAKDFDAAYNSFPVNSMVARMAQQTKKYGIRSTPSVIVNGKYKVNPSGLSESTNFTKDYVDLVNYLVTKKD